VAGVVPLPASAHDPLWKQTAQPMLADAGRIQTFLQDGAGTLWLGTGHGLCRWDGHLTRFTKAEGLAHDDVRALASDASGRLWIGTRDGVSCFEAGRFASFSERGWLRNDEVLALHVDGSGTVWAGTANGLNRIVSGHCFAFTNGAFARRVHQILEDEFGCLWLSGERGLVRVKRVHLEAVADGRANEAPSLSYGEADGMGSLLTLDGPQPAGCGGQDGRLYFPTTKGVAVVDPQVIRENRGPPPILLEQVMADGEVIQNDHLSTQKATGDAGRALHLRFPPGRGRALDIRFTTASLSAPEKLRFRYRLDGHEDQWHEAGLERRAVYTGLRPGSYSFQACAADASGQWGVARVLLAAQTTPFVRETWAFRIACGIGLMLAINGIVLWRFRLQRKILLLEQDLALGRDRARIAQDLHDELGTDLAHLEAQAGELTRNGQAVVGSSIAVSTLAGDLSRKLREMVWVIDPEKDTLADFASHVCDHAHSFLASTDIRLRLDIGEECPTWPLHANTRRHLSAIVKEALTNSVKHSTASEIKVSLRLHGDALNMALEDNGCGFDLGAERHGNGLNNLEDRTAKLGGKIEITSRPSQGTAMRVRVPLARLTGSTTPLRQPEQQ